MPCGHTSLFQLVDNILLLTVHFLLLFHPPSNMLTNISEVLENQTFTHAQMKSAAMIQTIIENPVKPFKCFHSHVKEKRLTGS